jgi:hypothetical protein
MRYRPNVYFNHNVWEYHHRHLYNNSRTPSNEKPHDCGGVGIGLQARSWHVSYPQTTGAGLRRSPTVLGTVTTGSSRVRTAACVTSPHGAGARDSTSPRSLRSWDVAPSSNGARDARTRSRFVYSKAKTTCRSPAPGTDGVAMNECTPPGHTCNRRAERRGVTERESRGRPGNIFSPRVSRSEAGASGLDDRTRRRTSPDARTGRCTQGLSPHLL